MKNKNGVLNVSPSDKQASQRRRLHRDRPFHRLKVRSKSWRCWPWIESPSGRQNSTNGTSRAAKPTEYIVQDMEILLQGFWLGQSPTLHVGMLVQPLNLPVKLTAPSAR